MRASSFVEMHIRTGPDGAGGCKLCGWNRSGMSENSWPEIALRGQRKYALARGREIAELRARIAELEGQVKFLEILKCTHNTRTLP